MFNITFKCPAIGCENGIVMDWDYKENVTKPNTCTLCKGTGIKVELVGAYANVNVNYGDHAELHNTPLEVDPGITILELCKKAFDQERFKEIQSIVIVKAIQL